MKKNNSLLLTIAVLVIFTIGCDDVFEKDISDVQITQIFPQEGQIITSNEVPFQWGDEEDATSFRVQVAQENGLFIRDTLVDAISYSDTFVSGTYKWRVRAENFAFQSSFTDFINFSVNEPVELTDVRLVLNTPKNNIFLNSPNILFGWEKIINATSYSFTLTRIINGAKTIVFGPKNVEDNQIQIEADSGLDEDGVYMWSVKALNSETETETEEFSRTFSIDTQVPPEPQLITPAIDQEFSLTSEIDFSWAYNDEGVVQSGIETKIEISRREDFLTLLDDAETTDLDYSYTPLEAGTFYWRIFGVDQSGNRGETNAEGIFRVN